MVMVEVNMMAIFMAALAGWVLGALWYSPALFGNIWMKHAKISKKSTKKNMSWPMFANFLMAMTTALVLDLLIQVVPGLRLQDSLLFAFLIWVGFLATALMNPVIWENRSYVVYWVNSLHQLVMLLVMTAVLFLF